MLRLCAISLTFLLSSLSCFAWSNLDTGRLAIDIRRVQLHEDIDALQVKLYGVDGKQDKIIAASRDIDLNLLLTDVYTRQVDLLQNEIETDSALDHRAKVKYLTGLKLALEEGYRALRSTQISAETAIQLFEAFKVYYSKDKAGIGLGKSVEQYAYPINKILLGDNTVFFENPGLNLAKVVLFQQFADLHPGEVLVKIEPYLDQPFADSLLIGCANVFPDKFYNYAAAAETKVGKRIRIIKDPFVELIVKISDERSGRLIFPFLHAIQKGRLSIDSVKQTAKDNLKYYKLLVKTQLEYIDELRRKDTPVLYKELSAMIKRKAEELYINEINALHDLPDEKRFKVLQPLTAPELYYIIVTGEDVIYTSSYVGVYNRMLAKAPQRNGDSLLMQVKFDRFKKFIRMAASYNKLDAFLATMQPGNAQLLMKAFVRGLEKTNNLEDAVDVADSYGSIGNPAIVQLMKQEIAANLNQNQLNNNSRGEAIYDILNLLFLSADDSTEQLTNKYNVPPVYQVPTNLLMDTSGRVVQQLFFYGDKDGMLSFQNFLGLFKGKKEWKIIQNQNWVEIQSQVGKPVLIFANKPLDNAKGDDPDAKAQRLLIEYMVQNGIEPTIVIHRGHSYHLKYTIDQLSPSAKIVILGSCGSYQNLTSVLQICPDAQIVSSKEVGSKLVNEPVLNLINESLLFQESIDWISMWNTLGKQFEGSEAEERFQNYIPPHKNLGALFIKAFNNREL
jgi:hypothetical protein